MAIKRIRCNCGGKPMCKLCAGTGKYDYDPGPMGYMPFRCPTCEGQRTLADDDGTQFPCPTCKAEGTVDPAHPPPAGMWDVLTKILFGA
jgi:DnaJ-class molecular chaperone